MKKRGISKLVLISSVAILIVLAAFLYIYTGEKTELTPEEQETVKPPYYEEKKEIELTPEELEKAKAIGLTEEEAKTAKSLDITPEEFNKTYTKAYEAFIEGVPIHEGFERPEIVKAIGYYEIEDFESLKYDHPDLQDLEIKPGSKLIRVEFGPMIPSPYIIYLIEDGKAKVLVEESYPQGELS